MFLVSRWVANSYGEGYMPGDWEPWFVTETEKIARDRLNTLGYTRESVSNGIKYFYKGEDEACIEEIEEYKEDF